MNPTDEQKQWFWEQCGVQGKWVDGGRTLKFLKIDLNNLFKYEPLTARGYHIETDNYKREVNGVMGQCSCVTIIEPKGNIASCYFKRNLEDALFWAIYKALGGKE